MRRFLRRVTPENPVLAVLLWVVVALVGVAGLFTLFFYLDRYLPGGGMF